MTTFTNLVVAGITSGAIYGILAAYIAIWFRVGRMMNLVVGDFAMIGAMGTATLTQDDGLPLWTALPLMIAIVVALTWAFDRGVLHFAFRTDNRTRGIVRVFFFTFGLSQVLQGLARIVFGTDVRAAPPVWSGAPFHIGGVTIQRPAIVVVVMAVMCGFGLWYYLRFTVGGIAATAAGESSLGSRVVGIDSSRFRRWIFVLTAALAGLFGIIESPLTGFVYNSGTTIDLLGVVAAGFAGFRRPGRAVIFGLAIGLVESFIGGYVNSSYNDLILYCIVLLIIVARPQVLGVRASDH